jgi:four helix bundle protein
MKLTRFEDIIAWQKSQDLAVAIYAEFRDSKDWGFRDQITQAVVSISNNIAEGFERGTDADFARFLFISKASCNEVKSMIYLAHRLHYLNPQKQENLIRQADEISRILHGLIQSIKK